jgi:hypothetical protein
VRTQKYPLELSVELREKKVHEAAGALERASRERDRAERQKAQSQQRCDAHGAAATRVRISEQEALSRGRLRVADLSRTAAWEMRVAREGEALAGELSGARAEEANARAAEIRAQEQVASRRSESQLVVNHRTRWRDGQRKRVEAKEEEGSEEAWRCRPNKTQS